MAHVRENPSTDATANAQTAYSLSAGDTFNGVFEDKQDNDWLRVELVEGKTYEIHLASAGDNSGDGNDLLGGGYGNDELSGGPGADVFVFAHDSGYDVVRETTSLLTCSHTAAERSRCKTSIRPI